MPNPRHEDFGEKIGGAKKDLWRERGLYASDLEDMNDRETEKFVKKDNIWKKPDYQALIDGGVPADVAYFIKLVWYNGHLHRATYNPIVFSYFVDDVYGTMPDDPDVLRCVEQFRAAQELGPKSKPSNPAR